MKVWGDESRVRASAWRRAMALAIGAALALAMVAIGAAPAAAQTTFQWKDVANGNWPDAGNWVRTNGPDNGFGYPRGNGDVAIFTGAYSGPQTLLVPASFTVLVGEIIHTAAVNVTIAADTGGQISLVPLAGANAQISVSGNVILSFNIPMNLGATVNVSVTTGTVRMNAPVSGNGAAGLVKIGPGGLLLGGTNTYAGTTTVREGGVSLAALLGGAIPGPLVIGDGAGGAQSARVTVGAADQIADAATVTVLSDGLLNVSAPDVVGELAIATGTAVSDAGGALTMGRLTMTGGVLESTNDGLLVLSGDVVATSNATTPAFIRRNGGAGTLSLLDATRTFTVDEGPNLNVLADLEVSLPIIGTGTAGLIKAGTGTFRFAGIVVNQYTGETVVRRGVFEDAGGSFTIRGELRIGTGEGAAEFHLVRPPITSFDPTAIAVGPDGFLVVRSTSLPGRLSVTTGGRVLIEGPTNQTRLAPMILEMAGGVITINPANGGLLSVRGELIATSTTQPSVIQGNNLFFSPPERSIRVEDGPLPIDLRIDSVIVSAGNLTLVKRGAGAALLTADDDLAGNKFIVAEGTLLINGVQDDVPFQLTGGTLGGTGTLGPLAASGGRLSPGVSPGRLTSGPVALTAGATFAVELTGTTPGSGYDQLVVNGSVDLGNAALAIVVGGPLPPLATFTVLVNDAADPITGTFAGLPEGASVQVGSHTFSISYAGGSGNDVVLTNGGDDDDGEETPVTYFLAEGATGAFFDEDLLIANPNDAEAPVTLTFLQEGGNTVVERRTLAPQSRMTVNVEEIAGLEETSASVQVTSDDRLPLIVERSMFWDQTYYGGHTANAVAQPERRWILAEGAQGTFDTYILIANPNPEPITATLTFLREQEGPFVATEPIAPFARKTIYAGDYPEVVNRAFGVVVDTTQPVMVERAMYFATLPGKLWGGGHVNTGIVAPATSWFHAEGATGGFFFTFILLSNPQDTPAQVDLQFLLPTGEVIAKTKTLKALERLTINPAEEDPRLRDAALSTVVQSDVPIVSERSMYWRGDAEPFGEGHNSTGVVSAGTRWGLAEGRIGGPQAFDTFILLANPSTTAAEVTVTYLRETGAPIVQTHVVPPTSRFNIDVKDFVPELRDSSFGARIEVTNGVPIAVERSMYWDANGIFWAGGTNALATPLP